MTHHRCTRCKQESYPRHKYYGGVYCDDCIHLVQHGAYSGQKSRGWLGSLWDKVVDFATSIFRPRPLKQLVKAQERASYARLKALEFKARSIPPNPQGGSPQKY